MARPESDRLWAEDCGRLSIAQALGSPLPPRWAKEISLEVSGTTHEGLRFELRARAVRGSRGWRFECPECGRRAMYLYFPPGETDAACRVCLRLVFESQYLEPLPPNLRELR